MSTIFQENMTVNGKAVGKANPEIEDQTISGVNRLAARSNLIPAQKEGVFYKNKEESERLLNLNGDWQFLYHSSDDEAGFYATEADDSAWDTIDVPSMWQYRGYGKCRYPNIMYHIPFHPPYICCENPVGYYRRHFTVSHKAKNTILHFGGVDNAFYVYLNGKYVGFSKGSRIPSEFDVSTLVQEGDNVIAVKVFTYSDATYLENQDMLMANGIFRDVYLLCMDEVYLWDYRVKSNPKGFEITMQLNGTDFSGWQVEAEVDGIRQVFAAEKELVCKFELENPKLWNSEEPNLYELRIRVISPEQKAEIHSKKIGIMYSEVRGHKFLVNGKKVYIKGVNRHEYNCKNGRAITVEQIEKELRMIKENNLNAIRCSHYTNQPAFYELCSEIGIFVMDEGDLESHGCGETGDQGYLSKKPEWLSAYTDRIERMLMQNKNEVCIFMRSVGNECGRGENLNVCEKLIREFDPTRVCINDQQLQLDEFLKGTHEGEVETIARVGYISEENLQKAIASRPLLAMIEYAHAMGNSPGFLEDYQKYVYENDNFIGGFVWEFKNHGFYTEDEKGNPYYLYGGDFEDADRANWHNFCLDGYLMSDGTPKPSWYELGEVFAPVYVTYDEESGIIRAKNTYNFKKLDTVELRWEICEDYTPIRSGKLRMPAAEPHEECELPLDIRIDNRKSGAKYFLNLRFYEEDTYVGTTQIKIGEEKQSAGERTAFEGEITVQAGKIVVSGRDFEADFDGGMLCRYVKDGKAFIDAPMEFNMFRAATDNDGIDGMRAIDSFFCLNRVEWQEALLRTISFYAEETEAYEENGLAVIRSCGRILPEAKYYGFDVELTYKISGDGVILTDIKGIPYGHFTDCLPRIGVHFTLNQDMVQTTWYGRGKRQNYIDCKKAAPIGLYTAPISETYTVFDMPQETGNHENTSFVTVGTEGRGITVAGCDEFCFSYLEFTVASLDKAKHRNEVIVDANNHLYIDYKMHGLGSHSCGPDVEERYRLHPHAFEFAFTVSPAMENAAALELARTDFGVHSGKYDKGGEDTGMSQKEIAAKRTLL